MLHTYIATYIHGSTDITLHIKSAKKQKPAQDCGGWFVKKLDGDHCLLGFIIALSSSLAPPENLHDNMQGRAPCERSLHYILPNAALGCGFLPSY